MQDNQYKTISRIFHGNCEKFSSRRAQAFNTELYHSNNGSFTYGEMKDRVEKMACGLLALGFEKNERARPLAVHMHGRLGQHNIHLGNHRPG